MIPITINVPDGKEKKYLEALDLLVKSGALEVYTGQTIIHWSKGTLMDIESKGNLVHRSSKGIVFIPKKEI